MAVVVERFALVHQADQVVGRQVRRVENLSISPPIGVQSPAARDIGQQLLPREHDQAPINAPVSRFGVVGHSIKFYARRLPFMPFGFVELTIADAREQSNAKVFVQLSQVLTIRRINDTTHLEFAAGTGETETRTVAAQLQPPRLSRPPRLAVVETPDEIWAAVQRTR